MNYNPNPIDSEEARIWVKNERITELENALRGIIDLTQPPFSNSGQLAAALCQIEELAASALPNLVNPTN